MHSPKSVSEFFLCFLVMIAELSGNANMIKITVNMNFSLGKYACFLHCFLILLWYYLLILQCLLYLLFYFFLQQVAKESGYNMIHFMPLQSLGESNSSYCLKNQLQPNPIFSQSVTCTFEEIGKLVSYLINFLM